MRTVGWAALALVVVVGLVIGGWQLGWWLSEESTNRRTQIANDSVARQSALVDEVLDKARDARNIDVQLAEASETQKLALRAQRVAIVDQMCDAWGQLTGRMTVPASVEAFALEECA